MKLRFTQDAQGDLAGIGDYIALDSPRRAKSFVEEIVRRCEALVDQPYGSALVPRYEAHGIRRAIYGRYLIFYRNDPETVVVLRILHASLDYEEILFSEL